MALKNTLTPETAPARLAEAIQMHVDGASDVSVTDVEIPHSSGMSNETALFTATWREHGHTRTERLVARLAPTGPSVFPRHDYGLEGMVMQALAAASDVRVPEVLFFTEDRTALGSACMVMQRVDGKVAADDPPFTTEGWVLELDAASRTRLVDGALRTLADLHAVDVDAAGLSELKTHAEAGLDGQLRFYRDFFKWAAQGEPNPTVEAGFAWLDANRPDDLGDQVLTWGDARIGNIIYSDDLAVAAVLDWEMVAYGPAAMDIGWMAFLNRHHSEGIGVPLPEGILSSEETVARYEQLTDRRIGDLRYWEVLAAVKLSVMMHRAGHLMVEHGLMPPDTPMKLNNPATQILARLAELPAPTGDAQTFIGNR